MLRTAKKIAFYLWFELSISFLALCIRHLNLVLREVHQIKRKIIPSLYRIEFEILSCNPEPSCSTHA